MVGNSSRKSLGLTARLGMARERGALWHYVSAFALVLIASGATEGLHRIAGTSRLASVFLTAVLITAFLFGAPPAYFAAALAFVGYDLFITGPSFVAKWGTADVVNLVAFFSVAMLTGNLTGRNRDEARRARARAHATAALFDATRDFSATDDEVSIRDRLAHHLASAARGKATVGRGPRPEEVTDLESNGMFVSLGHEFPMHAPEGDIRTVKSSTAAVRPLYADGLLVGAAAWVEGDSGGGDREALLEILSDVGAAAIGRARLAAAKADAESRVKTEELRNALLSSISHDLRTPLAAILAASSSLDEFGDSFDQATRADLAKTIQEEAERLNHFVSNLLSMTKLESGVLTPNIEPFEVQEVVQRTVKRRIHGRHQREVKVECPPELFAQGDAVLFEQALGNVVENALRYTPPQAGVWISCEKQAQDVVISVADEGPGVSSAELIMLFVKFYRTTSAEKLRGTGLGLSITKGLIEGMGGNVAAHNRPAPETGLVVTLTLPAAVDDPA